MPPTQLQDRVPIAPASADRPASSGSFGDAARHLDAMVRGHRWQADEAIDALHAAGCTATRDIVGLATQVARDLGDRWVADTCSFADVTLGLHRLTLLLFAAEDQLRHRPLHGGGVVLAPAADDQHGFGLATVALALREHGWDVTLLRGGDERALLAAARRGVDCIGLSVGHDRAVPATVRLIESIRAATSRRHVTIAVGGPMLTRDPSLAERVGADLAAVDGFALAALLGVPAIARAA